MSGRSASCELYSSWCTVDTVSSLVVAVSSIHSSEGAMYMYIVHTGFNRVGTSRHVSSAREIAFHHVISFCWIFSSVFHTSSVLAESGHWWL